MRRASLDGKREAPIYYKTCSGVESPRANGPHFAPPPPPKNKIKLLALTLENSIAYSFPILHAAFPLRVLALFSVAPSRHSRADCCCARPGAARRSRSGYPTTFTWTWTARPSPRGFTTPAHSRCERTWISGARCGAGASTTMARPTPRRDTSSRCAMRPERERWRENGASPAKLVRQRGAESHLCCCCCSCSCCCLLLPLPAATDDGVVVCLPWGGGRQVSSGHLFTCGIRADETVTCWGQQSQPAPGLFLQISSGEFHVCGASQ